MLPWRWVQLGARVGCSGCLLEPHSGSSRSVQAVAWSPRAGCTAPLNNRWLDKGTASVTVAWSFRCCRDCHQKHKIWCLTHERSTAASQSGLLLRVLGLVCRPVQIAYLFVERHSILSHCSDRTYKSHVLLWNVHQSCMCLLMAKRKNAPTRLQSHKY